jgi:hypothetical protein
MVGDLLPIFADITEQLPTLICGFCDLSENRKRLAKALDELSVAPYEIVERMQFVPGWTRMNLDKGFPPDIMTSVKGLENFTFYECLELALKVGIANIKVPFLHIKHLLAAKKAAHRPKDQLDVTELEKIKAWREQHPDENI